MSQSLKVGIWKLYTAFSNSDMLFLTGLKMNQPDGKFLGTRQALPSKVAFLPKPLNTMSYCLVIQGGHQHPGVQQLAVSHSGVRLVRREKGPSEDNLQVLDTFR